MAVCGVAIFVYRCVVSGTNVALACAFVVEGAFSSFVASVNCIFGDGILL